MNRSRYHLLRLALAFDALTCVLMSLALLIAGDAGGGSAHRLQAGACRSVLGRVVMLPRRPVFRGGIV